MQTASCGRQALALAAAGRAAEALQLIERHAAEGDGEALFVRGLWRLEGKLLPRDPASSRDDLGQAAERGHQGAARIHAGFVAAGTGGAADWRRALGLLSDWSGKDPLAARQLEMIAAMDLTDRGDPVSAPQGEALSESPRVVRFAGLLAAEECRFLVELAEARFKPALIFHEAQQRFVRDPIRESDAASFPLVSEWPFVHAVNRRIAAASGTQASQGETLQILRYVPGQQYHPHLDAIPGLANQRRLTFLVWLSEGYRGGETKFLASGLAVAGRLGDGLMFVNALPDGRPDPASRHAGCPVTSGVKLIASRWIRERPPENPDEGFGRHEAEGRG